MKKLFNQQIKVKPLITDFINVKWPVLVEGATGIGKNYLIETIAEEQSKKIIRINLNVNVSQEDLWGQNVLIKDDNASVIKFKDGPVVNAVKNGYWLLLDEVNAALPEVLFSLHALLERHKKEVYVPILQDNLEVHDDFRIIATMNPSDEYFGTRSLNQAFLSRFMLVELENPMISDIGNGLKNIYLEKEIEMATLIATKLIQEFHQWNVKINISVRDFEKIIILMKTEIIFINDVIASIFRDYVKLLPEEALKTFNTRKIKEGEQELAAISKFLKDPLKFINLINLIESGLKDESKK